MRSQKLLKSLQPTSLILRMGIFYNYITNKSLFEMVKDMNYQLHLSQFT